MDRVKGSESLVVMRHRNHTGHDDRALRRAVEAGRMRRLRSGAFVDAQVWAALRPDERRRLEVAAAAEMNPALVGSHRSAAALWGVPSIRTHDGLVHARVTAAAGSRTEHGVRKHAVQDTELHLETIGGISVVSLERTILDLAATEPFAEAVVAMDWALRGGTSRARLHEVLDEWGPVRGRVRVESVIAFGDGDSGSAGESWSRVQIAEAGLPAPLLQVRFDDGRGLIGFVDFYWPEHGLVGEFDGFEKYRSPEMLRGRTPSEALTDEKVREDRLRSCASRPRVERWVWRTLLAPSALPDQLLASGLQRERSARSRSSRL